MFNKQNWSLVYLILPVTLLFASCSGKASGDNDSVIDIGTFLNEGTLVPLSSVASEIEYICLEVNPESIFGNLDITLGQRIESADDIYFVNDETRLLSFDNTGQFIRQIGAQGRGPGEYVDVWDFSVCEVDKEVAIISLSIRKILFYSFDGEFLRDITLDFHPTAVTFYNGKLVLANRRGTRQLTDYYTLIVMDKHNGAIVKRLIKREEDIKMDDGSGIVGNIRLFKVDDRLHYFETIGLDSIWTISDDFSVIERKHLWYGKDRMPFSEYSTSKVFARTLDELSKHVIYQSHIETEKFIFIRLGNKGRLAHLVYDKVAREGETLLYEDKLSGRKRWAFYNDMDGMLNFWPEGVLPGNKVFRLLYGNQIRDHLHSLEEAGETISKTSTSLSAAMENPAFKEMPVLMVVTLN